VPQIGLDGLRSLNHQNTAVTGTLGLVVAPTEQISFVARVGRSYREPNIYDRYNAGASHDLRPATRTITVPNPDLIAETGINVDAGVRLRTKRFAGGFTYFNNTYRNFISLGGQPIPGVAPVPGPFGPLTILQRVNANKLRMQGVEGEWEIPLRLGDSFLTPVGNVSYTHGDDLRTGLPVDPFWYPAMPLKLVAGARWNSLTNRYWWEYRARVQTGMDRLPPNSLYLRPGTARLGFTTHDLRGGVNWQREHYSIALTVGVENLGHRFYQDLYSLSDTPARGRAAIVGLKFKLF
jgi:hemoglobin/transferrin/lactoferrin receptor protein